MVLTVISQFLKFQAFAEQLTKETSELKVKIEGHKRENRRLTALIDQQKDDAARLSLRLSGTEKQRDDALEALVLQQEIAEELERERKRNQKDISALQHTTATLTRQRDEAQRIVVHLRSLIEGQTHHMEHIIRNLANSTDLNDYVEQGYEEIAEEQAETRPAAPASDSKLVKRLSRPSSRLRMSAGSRASSVGDNVTPEMEQHLLNMDKKQRRLSQMSMPDVADRYLRDKTDAIASIIRNISEQCAAAVEGLHLAQDAEEDMEGEGSGKLEQDGSHLARSEDGRDQSSEMGEGESSFLGADNRASSIPPTPDLVHNRSSTSMSMVSQATIPERSSQQYSPGDIPTKIVEDDDEHALETDGLDVPAETGTLAKQPSRDLMQSNTTRIVS
jgi:hypothetical protein